MSLVKIFSNITPRNEKVWNTYNTLEEKLIYDFLYALNVLQTCLILVYGVNYCTVLISSGQSIIRNPPLRETAALENFSFFWDIVQVIANLKFTPELSQSSGNIKVSKMKKI